MPTETEAGEGILQYSCEASTGALSVARGVQAEIFRNSLRQNGFFGLGGPTPLMTRTGDVSNPSLTKLQWRTDLANNAGADVFVSIHLDASPSSSTSGMRIFYTSQSGLNLANSIASSQTAMNLTSSSPVQQRSDLFVLNRTSASAVLIEVGFLTNASDLAIVKTNAQEIGTEIARGILNFLKP